MPLRGLQNLLCISEAAAAKITDFGGVSLGVSRAPVSNVGSGCAGDALQDVRQLSDTGRPGCLLIASSKRLQLQCKIA